MKLYPMPTNRVNSKSNTTNWSHFKNFVTSLGAIIRKYLVTLHWLICLMISHGWTDQETERMWETEIWKQISIWNKWIIYDLKDLFRNLRVTSYGWLQQIRHLNLNTGTFQVKRMNTFFLLTSPRNKTSVSWQNFFQTYFLKFSDIVYIIWKYWQGEKN